MQNGNRVVSALGYLSSHEDEDGGQTEFPRLQLSVSRLPIGDRDRSEARAYRLFFTCTSNYAVSCVPIRGRRFRPKLAVW